MGPRATSNFACVTLTRLSKERSGSKNIAAEKQNDQPDELNAGASAGRLTPCTVDPGTVERDATSREIAAQRLLAAMDTEDQKMLRVMTKPVSVALRDQRDRGRVVSIEGPGTYLLWKVNRP